jgi:peptide/nickel transport system permease protein
VRTHAPGRRRCGHAGVEEPVVRADTPGAAEWRLFGCRRDQVIKVKVEDYIEAARAIGNSPLRIVLRHGLPNVTASLIEQATLAVAAAVIAEASLSFLGLGQQPPAPSWGSMLNTAKNYVDSAPWMAAWRGLSIFALVLSFNLLGDGLRDALDPRQR